MENIKDSIIDLVGNTPLIRLKKIEKEYGIKAKLYAKVEYFNPFGSVKDRIAKEMIEDYEKKGLLKEGSTIIEPTSGNTGIALSAIGVNKGYKVIIVMPDTMTKERRNLIKAYGAEIVLTDGALGMKGAIAKANELKMSIKDSIIAGQFDNEANPLAHYKYTSREIFNALDGHVDALVSGVGTGGTVSGIGKYLKEQNKDAYVLAVEPEGSPVLSLGYAGRHAIQGIGAGFVPNVLNKDIIDEIIRVSDIDAKSDTRMLARLEGLLCGISSGAAVHAGIILGMRKEFEGKNIVIVLPDSGMRYLSTDTFE